MVHHHGRFLSWRRPQYFILSSALILPALLKIVSCRHYSLANNNIFRQYAQNAPLKLSELPQKDVGECFAEREFMERNITNKQTSTASSRRNGRTNKISTVPNFQTSTIIASIRGGAATTAGAASAEFTKRLFVSAAVTLMYEGVIGHLLEFLKIVMQTSPPGTTYVEVLRRITADKGIAGVWDGFLPWGVVQAVLKGGIFGLAYSMALSVLMPLAENGHIPKQLALTLAGGIAGGIQGYVLSPTLLLKTRVMTNDIFRESMSLWRTTLLSFRLGWDVIQTEGVGALMKGSNVFAFKRVCDWASRYYFSDIFGKMLLNHAGTPTLTPSEKIAADLLGGTASTLVTLPLDVIVAKIQDAKKAGAKVSPWTLFQEELKEGGWKVLSQNYLQGFEARLLHVCFTTVAMKTGTAFFYDFLFGASKKATT